MTVCGFSVGAQENWLITQHINTVLPGGGGERLRKVTVQFEGSLNGCDISRQCRQSFDVYKWQTSTINRTAAANTTIYAPVLKLFRTLYLVQTGGSSYYLQRSPLNITSHPLLQCDVPTTQSDVLCILFLWNIQLAFN